MDPRKKMANILPFVAEFVLCGGTLLTIVAAFTRHWREYQADTYYGNVTWGLFDFCFERLNLTDCDVIENPEDYILGCRALVCIAIILTVTATLVSFLHVYKLYRQNPSRQMVIAIIAMCGFAVTCQVLAAIVYGAMYKSDSEIQVNGMRYELSWELGGSYVTNIVAAVGLVVACFLVWFSYTRRPVLLNAGGIVMQPSVIVYSGQPQPYTHTIHPIASVSTNQPPAPMLYSAPYPPHRLTAPMQIRPMPHAL